MHLRGNWWLLAVVFAAALAAGLLWRGWQRPLFCHAAWMDDDGAAERKMLFSPVKKQTKTVALTFDDGPKAGVTDWLLDELEQRNVKATFFLIGNQLEGNEAIIEKMYEDGHQIGCHTFSHVQLTLLSEQEQKEEILHWYETVSAVIGDFSYCIRPPYGSVNNRVCDCLDIPVILWSVDTKDWTGKSSEAIAQYIISEAEDGDIILLHDIFEESVHGAVMALDELQRRGYTFVTVNELLEQKGMAVRGGSVYRRAVRK